MICEKGHFCKIHPPGGCIHGNYDYSFSAMSLKEPFYVEEVHFVCPPYLKQNERLGQITAAPQLVTYDWGTINSGSKRSVASAEEIRSLIQKTGKHVLCEIKIIDATRFGKLVCVVVPATEPV